MVGILVELTSHLKVIGSVVRNVFSVMRVKNASATEKLAGTAENLASNNLSLTFKPVNVSLLIGSCGASEIIEV